jgi:hypothetical protein
LGNKILRQRLKGPALAAYYPRKSATVEDIQKEFAKFDLVTWNEEEEDRLEGLQIAKLRGKGAPKKKRTADGELIHLLFVAGGSKCEGGIFADMDGLQQARKTRKRGDLRMRIILERVYIYALAALWAFAKDFAEWVRWERLHFQ